MNRPLTFITIPVLALGIGGVVQVVRPLPSLELQAAASPLKLPGEFQVSFPSQGQMAVGEESLGLVSASRNQEPVAIASLTKMMTAYLLLKAQPLKLGEDGPTSTITAIDVQEYLKDKALGDSVVKVSVGEKLSERQLLEALLLPSADNIATLIANQLAGSEANFVPKMNQAAHALGMSQTTYADAAGVNPATASTANDQLRMAQAVMGNRIFRDIVRMPQAISPAAGLIYNVNFMVGKQGMTGIKTGSTLAAGSCFVGSFPITVNGASRILLGAVLGQQSLHQALSYDTAMLHAVSKQFKDYPVSPPANGFAQLTVPWGSPSKLEISKPLTMFGYPGMPIQVTAKLTQAKLPIQPGQEIGALSFSAGNTTQSAGLVSTNAIQKPELSWRLRHI